MRNERRHTYREPVNLDAVIVDDVARLPCVVLDRTEIGFRLYVATPFDVPADFTLEFLHDGSSFACTRMWQQDDEIGVRLVSSDAE